MTINIKTLFVGAILLIGSIAFGQNENGCFDNEKSTGKPVHIVHEIARRGNDDVDKLLEKMSPDSKAMLKEFFPREINEGSNRLIVGRGHELLVGILNAVFDGEMETVQNLSAVSRVWTTKVQPRARHLNGSIVTAISGLLEHRELGAILVACVNLGPKSEERTKRESLCSNENDIPQPDLFACYLNQSGS